MKRFGIAVLIILGLVGISNATEPIDHADYRPVTHTISAFVGEKFLSDSPYGLSGSLSEYGIEYEYKTKSQHYWSLVASLTKGSTSGSVGTSTCTTTNTVTRGWGTPSDHNGPDGDNDADDALTTTPTTHCVSSSISSSLDTVALGLGLKRHWHVIDYKIQPYVAGGINLMNADLKVGGASQSGTALGLYAGLGLVYEANPFVFKVGYKFDYDPIIGYNFGGSEFTIGGGIEF